MPRGDLHNLIRLNEWQVDEKRRRLGELVRVLDDLELRAAKLEEEVANEQRIAAASPEAAMCYPAYAVAVIDRRERLARSIEQAKEEVEAAHEELREAYRELKKFEVAQERRDQRAKLEADRREQVFLDEIGLRGFRRRNESLTNA